MACSQRVVDGRAAEVAGHLVQREAVVGTEREHDGVVAGRRLQLEVEGAAELLAQREPERAVDPPAVRRVHHELHAAGLVEEALEHELLLRGHRAEHRPRRPRGSRRPSWPARRRCPRCRPAMRGRRRGRRAARNASTAARSSDTSARQLGGARRRLTHPERDGRRRVAGVAHPHHAGLDLADLPRVGAEQEDVARHRLDRPVLVDGADEGVVGLGHDAVVAGLGDRTARGDRGEARALAAAQLAVDRVVVHVRAPAPRPVCDAVADEVDDLVELRAGQLGVRRGAAHEREQVVGLPLLRADLGDDLLRERCRAAAAGSWMASSRPARTAARSAVHSTSSSRVSG